MRKRQSFSLVLLLAGILLFSLAFDLNTMGQADAADPGPENGIRATVQAAVDAYNRADLGAFLPLWTDKGFEEEMDQTKAEAAADEEFFGDQVVLRAVRDITQTSTGATAIVELEFGLGVEANTYSFILVDGRWRIDGSTSASPAVKPGTAVVDLKLQEFAFVYDKQAVASGNVAFKVENVGKQEHEMVLLKIDGSLSAAEVREMLLSEGEGEGEGESGPPPFEDFGFLGVLQPGQTATAALSHPLETGKYVFVCFVEDPADGLPHLAKGMISEFTVGSATGAITPPSTGDGGLLPIQSASAQRMVFGITLLLVALGLAAARRPYRL